MNIAYGLYKPTFRFSFGLLFVLLQITNIDNTEAHLVKSYDGAY